jgi:mannose-1-phosphate guanylyltransferase
MNEQVVILAGGRGTRLWPLSDDRTPKQFLPLPYDRSLIAQAVERALSVVPPKQLWIITLASQVEATRRALPDFPAAQIIPEPVGRNTAAAACLATLWIEARAGEPSTILLLPADHFVPDVKEFSRTMKVGLNRAADGESLITFGLKIAGPKTDFGYIEVETTSLRLPVRKAKRFIEKPPLAKAKVFAKSRHHYWNSGMFAWRSDFFRREMERHAARIFRPLSTLSYANSQPQELESVYSSLPNISIDYVLMEKSKSLEVVPSKFAWSDLGTWAAVCEAALKKPKDNLAFGRGRVVDGCGNFVRSGEKPIVLFGVDNLVVVEGPEGVLVTTREKSRDLKTLLGKL